MKKYDYLEVSSVVEELMAKKESDEIEFKSAAGGFPSSFWRPIPPLPIPTVEPLYSE